MKQNIFTKYKWAKPVLIGTAVVVSYAVLSKLFKNSDNTKYEQGNYSMPDNVSGLNVTLLAQRLHDAMKYMGTDLKEIHNVLANIDESQFRLIAQRFGKRPYNTILGNQRNFNPFSELKKYTLKEWLQYELSEREYRKLRDKYPNTL